MKAQEVKTEYSKIKLIEGWFQIESAMIIGLINKIQKNHNIKGNIFEIGVLYGKSSLFLSGLLNSVNEKIEYCDVFFDDKKKLDLPRKEKFYDNMQTFMGKYGYINHKVYECNSKELGVKIIGGDYRFFHIDGCHEMDYVYHDMKLAIHNMVDYGVIIIDDFLSAIWPGVSEAVILLLKEYKEFAPFLIAHNKLYICRRKYLYFYLNFLNKNSNQKEYFENYSLKTEKLLNSPVKVAYKPWLPKSNSVLNRTIRKIGRVMVQA